MEPKTQTILAYLDVGDRFFYNSDQKNKKVWQIKSMGKAKRWIAPGGIVKSADVLVTDDLGAIKWSQSSTKVTFLRHTAPAQSPAASSTTTS